MTLSPMRFKDYVWPHNPRVYEIQFTRAVAQRKIPFGMYTLQSLGRGARTLRGEGEFTGPGAYREFKKLASVLCEESPGVLVHPVWQTSRAWFVSLSLRQEPTEDYVAYAFEFLECYDGWDAGTAGQARTAAAAPASAAGQRWRTLKAGNSLCSVAAEEGLSTARLAALNPLMKNPNLLRPGDRLRVE